MQKVFFSFTSLVIMDFITEIYLTKINTLVGHLGLMSGE